MPNAQSGDCSGDTTAVENPPIAFEAPDLSVTYTLGESADDVGTLVPLEHMYDTSLLDGPIACVPQLQDPHHAFLRVGTGDAAAPYTFYHHDPRLQLIANTVEQPANGTVSGANLPAVPKSLLNAATCQVLLDQGTSSYSSAFLTLNRSMVRNFYSIAGRYVYVVDGLRLEEPYDKSPCSGVSRWRRWEGACAEETPLDADTRDSVVASIRLHTDGGEEVIDVELRGACDDRNATAARVTVDGDCWEHSHPEQARAPT